MKEQLIVLVFCLMSSLFLQAQGEYTIQGTVTDEGTGAAILFATIALYDSLDVLIAGVDTDFDGHYFFQDLSRGKYTIGVSFLGYQEQKKSLLLDEKKVTIDFQLVDQQSISICFKRNQYTTHIYQFKNGKSIEGILFRGNSDRPAKFKKVYLVGEDGKILERKTNSKGVFKFESLEIEEYQFYIKNIEKHKTRVSKLNEKFSIQLFDAQEVLIMS